MVRPGKGSGPRCFCSVFNVIPPASRTWGRSRQFLGQGEEPLRAAAAGGAERPGEAERASQQSPAGAARAEGAGDGRGAPPLRAPAQNGGAMNLWPSASTELRRPGGAGDAQAAGRPAAAAALHAAEEVRGQARRAGGGQSAAAGRATRQPVNHEGRSAGRACQSKRTEGTCPLIDGFSRQT